MFFWAVPRFHEDEFHEDKFTTPLPPFLRGILCKLEIRIPQSIVNVLNKVTYNRHCERSEAILP